jgi:ankyrin repeat protein
MIKEDYSQNAKSFVEDCIEFIDAAETGDIDKLRKMLDDGLPPDIQGPKGWTALRKAAVKNNFDVAFELLKRGADVDAVNFTGKTALMMACAYGHYEVVSLLLFYGADPDLIHCGGRTALMIAASHGHESVVGALLNESSRMNINRKDPKGKTALHMAVENGYGKVAGMIEAAGAMQDSRATEESKSNNSGEDPGRIISNEFSLNLKQVRQHL